VAALISLTTSSSPKSTLSSPLPLPLSLLVASANGFEIPPTTGILFVGIRLPATAAAAVPGVAAAVVVAMGLSEAVDRLIEDSVSLDGDALAYRAGTLGTA
jgi:hypothetical protein